MHCIVFRSIMLKVTKVPRVPRLQISNLLCIILYFHSIMLKVTKVPRVPRLPVGNLLYVTVCHILNNAQFPGFPSYW